MPSMVATAASPTRRDRRQAGARRLPVEVDGAGAAEPDAATELAALQVKFVAQHPKQGHIAVDVDGSLQAVHLDRIGHRPRLLILIVEFALALRTPMGLDPPNATRLERRRGKTMARGRRSRRGRRP